MCDGFSVCRALCGTCAGSPPAVDRPLGQARLGVVVREQFWLVGGLLGKALLQHLGDAAMQMLTAALEQGPVCRVLDKGVLEEKGRVWQRAATENQAGAYELIKRGSQHMVSSIRHSGNQLVGELSANHSADFGEFLANGAKTVEAAHERRMESGSGTHG